jgi:RecA-family ATPase
MKLRRRRWIQENHGRDARIDFLDWMPLVGSSDFDWLVGVVAERQYDLIIIDTLRRFAGDANLNQPNEAGVAMDGLLKLSRASGGTALAIHHVGLGDKARMSGARQMFADVDFVLEVEDNEGVVSITADKFKDADSGRARLDLTVAEIRLGDTEATTLVLRDRAQVYRRPDVFVPTRAHETIYTFLRNVDPLEADRTQAQVIAAVTEPKICGRTKAQEVIAELVRRDLVIEMKRDGWKKGDPIHYRIGEADWPTASAEHPDPAVRARAQDATVYGIFGGTP